MLAHNFLLSAFGQQLNLTTFFPLCKLKRKFVKVKANNFCV